MSNAYVIGVGLTKFGRHPEQSVEGLAADAIIKAIEDAQVNWAQVQQLYGCHVNQGVAAGQRVIKEVGPSGIPVLNIENCSAAASTAIREASLAVRSEEMDLVVVCGFEKMAHGVLLNVIPEQSPEVATGATVLPMRFALMAQKHCDEYGTTLNQIADVSVKNRRHALHNPNAQFQREVTREEILSSRMIADPITLYQCSPTTDGAAAVVICNDDFLRKRGRQRAIRLLASGLVSDIEEQAHNIYDLNMVANNITGVWERASLGPSDVDVVETHDCFSIAEIIAYEKLGLCHEGEGGRLLDEGATKIGGRIPVNPSGGLLGKGHPLGATGAAQVAEIVTQLRGEAGQRQVEGARIGLTSNMGMWSSCIHVLSR